MKLKNTLPLLFPMSGGSQFINVVENVGYNRYGLRLALEVGGTMIYAVGEGPSLKDIASRTLPRGKILQGESGAVLADKHYYAFHAHPEIEEVKPPLMENTLYHKFQARRQEQLEEEVAWALVVAAAWKFSELTNSPVPISKDHHKVPDAIIYQTGMTQETLTVHATVTRYGKEFRATYDGMVGGRCNYNKVMRRNLPEHLWDSSLRASMKLGEKYHFTKHGMVLKSGGNLRDFV